MRILMFAIFLGAVCSATDLNFDGKVDYVDFAIFAEDWQTDDPNIISGRYDYFKNMVDNSNCIVITPNDDLAAKYNWLKSSDRDAKMGVLSADNRRCLLVVSGVYTLDETLNLTTSYVDFIGMGATPVIEFAGYGNTVDIRCSYFSLLNLSIKQTSGDSEYEAVRWYNFGFNYKVIDVQTKDAKYGTMYFDDESPIKRTSSGPVIDIDSDMFTSGWTKLYSWLGEIIVISDETPWQGSAYTKAVADANNGGAQVIRIYKDFSTSPLDYSKKEIVLGYTVQPQNNQAFNYESNYSDGIWIIFTDGAGKTCINVGLPVLPGRHVCTLAPCDFAVNGFDLTNIVKIAVEAKGITTGITTDLPEIWFEDWATRDTTNLTPRICINVDDGFQRAVDNFIWPAVRAGIKVCFGVRFGYIGQPNYVTWDELERLQATGMVEISAHNSGWRGTVSPSEKVDYIRFGKQIFKAHGICGAGLDTYIIPQGTGGTPGQRPDQNDFNLMGTYYQYYRGIQRYITGVDGIKNQSGGTTSPSFANKPFHEGFLFCAALNSSTIGSSTGSNTNGFLDMGGKLDRSIAANMTAIYYFHNVANSGETANTDLLDNLLYDEAQDLIDKLVDLMDNSNVEIVFMSEI